VQYFSWDDGLLVAMTAGAEVFPQVFTVSVSLCIAWTIENGILSSITFLICKYNKSLVKMMPELTNLVSSSIDV